MGQTAIKAVGVSKRYAIGRQKAGSLRERLSESLSLSRKGRDFFWALKDIDFEVAQGEAVGIIGRNGAGKSTLLKVFSQITHPTSGKIEIDGRVASLLEVGTGFHPELTGRENIYLNGTILGMTRREVRMRLEEIIDFSGVENFIDTPVKHYSSGMYVRLAFAVAAHLEPEILIIDEVLAVGDSAFQKKCLGKMDDVAHSGKTVLFVSHNMAAIRSLCQKGLFLDEGRIQFFGPVEDAVKKYEHLNVSSQQSFDLRNIKRFRGAGNIRIDRVNLDSSTYFPASEFSIQLGLQKTDGSLKMNAINLAVFIADSMQNIIYHLSTEFMENEQIGFSEHSEYTFKLKQLNLSPGTYQVWIWLQGNGFEQDYVDSAVSFEVLEGNIYGAGSPKIVSIVQKEFEFQINP